MAKAKKAQEAVGPKPAEFKPYIPAEKVIPEFSPKAIVAGAIFGILFGAVTVYLGLKVGLTVSASIPIAVLSITLLRWLSRIFSAWVSRPTILENNIVQTTGSAGESIAAGVVFTLPALIFLGFDLEVWRVALVALVGGWLGVLFMIPLRRYLIVKEHGVLKYPEGTACADVLVAGEKGGAMASKVFAGLGLGLVYKFLMGAMRFWKEAPVWHPRFYPGSTVTAEISPELLGVGYIIGYRIAAVMVAGGVLSWLVLIPFIKLFGSGLTDKIYPGTKLIAEMTPAEIWSNYVRYIGAGAVAAGGILNLIRALPTIIDSFRASFREVFQRGAGPAAGKVRTERDMPITVVALGSLALVAVIWAILSFVVNPGSSGNLIASILVVIFGFFFVTVSSRIVGMIGSSSNPISGMTIATLMATSLIFVAVGWTGGAYAAVALSVGAVVCIAAANAGATSQDLKTGYLVGATPVKQQIGLMIGVMASVVVIGYTMMLVNRAYTRIEPAELQNVSVAEPTRAKAIEYNGRGYILATVVGSSQIPDGKYLVDPETRRIEYSYIEGIGGKELPAPQARLMSMVVSGLLDQRLPWGLVLLGIFIAVVVELCGVHALPFAVGAYLPLSTTSPIFVGGVVRRLVEKYGKLSEAEAESGSGVLFSSGLIAGGALAGLAIAGIAAYDAEEKFALGAKWLGSLAESSLFGLLVFLGLCLILASVAKKKLE